MVSSTGVEEGAAAAEDEPAVMLTADEWGAGEQQQAEWEKFA
jgi:hypothetical protein